jgi:hypothetical protein
LAAASLHFQRQPMLASVGMKFIGLADFETIGIAIGISVPICLATKVISTSGFVN